MPEVSPVLTLATGFLALALSGLHLGKKLRAARAILNLRNSALSREILLCTMAVGVGSVGIVYFAGQAWLPYLVLPVLFAAVVSIDLVYRSKPLKIIGGIHSAETSLTAALVLALSLQQPVWVLAILGIKLGLVARRYLLRKQFGLQFTTLPIIRLWSLVLALLMVLYAQFDYRILLTILFGEIIDRILFYKELKIPGAQDTFK
jgi:hypothetical protein